MTDSIRTLPTVPRERPTMPGSLTAVAERLEMLEESGQRIERKLEQVMTLLSEVLGMATSVHAENKDLIIRVATLEAKVELLELSRSDGK